MVLFLQLVVCIKKNNQTRKISEEEDSISDEFFESKVKDERYIKKLKEWMA